MLGLEIKLFVCIWSLFPNAFCLAAAVRLEKSRGVSQAAVERTRRGGLGSPTTTAPTKPRVGQEQRQRSFSAIHTLHVHKRLNL